MPHPRRPASPFRYFNSLPEVIREVLSHADGKPIFRTSAP